MSISYEQHPITATSVLLPTMADYEEIPNLDNEPPVYDDGEVLIYADDGGGAVVLYGQPEETIDKLLDLAVTIAAGPGFAASGRLRLIDGRVDDLKALAGKLDAKIGAVIDEMRVPDPKFTRADLSPIEITAHEFIPEADDGEDLETGNAWAWRMSYAELSRITGVGVDSLKQLVAKGLTTGGTWQGIESDVEAHLQGAAYDQATNTASPVPEAVRRHRGSIYLSCLTPLGPFHDGSGQDDELERAGEIIGG